jgi:hypothetical protein
MRKLFSLSTPNEPLRRGFESIAESLGWQQSLRAGTIDSPNGSFVLRSHAAWVDLNICVYTESKMSAQ